MSHRFLLAVLLTLCSHCAVSEPVFRSCLGNIETSNRKIEKAGVSYALWYDASDTVAKIRFAGREFEARVEIGNSWDGPWFKRIDDELYFSYLPREGGTIKFAFGPNQWFSGNCS